MLSQSQTETTAAIIRRRNRKPKQLRTYSELLKIFCEAPQDALLDRAVTAAGINRSIGWMELAATKGGGPPYHKCGRRVLYCKRDTLAWRESNSQRVRSTSEYKPDLPTQLIKLERKPNPNVRANGESEQREMTKLATTPSRTRNLPSRRDSGTKRKSK